MISKYPPSGSSEQKVPILTKLRKIKLFKNLSEEELAIIAPSFHETHYHKETIIFFENDLPSEIGSRIYFTIKGCVKLVKYSSDGESTIVRLSSMGEFFGVTGALTNKPMPFSAEALTDTEILYIDREHFIQCVNKLPKIALEMITALGEFLWFNYETHNQVVKKTDARVSKILLYHLKRDGFEETSEGKVLKINLPHDYIASMTGIAYEESVRIISRLKKNYGCINYLRGGKIIVLDVDKLKELALDDDAWSG